MSQPPKIPRSAVGPDLTARIRGRADVEVLRKLVAGTAVPTDITLALIFTVLEMREVALEDWGPPPWTAQATPQVRVCSDLLVLRGELCKAGGQSPDDERTGDKLFDTDKPAG